MDNFTALIIPLEDHADEVQRFRRLHVHKPGVRLPPHVSVIYPFEPTESITESVAEKLITLSSEHLPFGYDLGATGRFADARVLFLAPEPIEPFLALFRAVWNAFPAITPTFAEPVMHLTLAQEDPTASVDDLDAEFHRSHSRLLPIRTCARRLELYEKKNGLWSFVRNCGGEANPSVDPTSVHAPRNPGGFSGD